MLYNSTMLHSEIPDRLKPYFQEYDTEQLDFAQDANLVIQRTLEFGTWDEIRWLFHLYGIERVRLFVRQHGERLLKPVSFNYWRKLLGLRRWTTSSLPTRKGELWER